MFIETYDAAQPADIAGLLAQFAEHGILNVINGIIVGRPGGRADVLAHRAYEAVIRSALGAAARTDLPVIANLDFGHTDPVFTLPYGVVAEIDCANSTLTFSEPAVRG